MLGNKSVGAAGSLNSDPGPAIELMKRHRAYLAVAKESWADLDVRGTDPKPPAKAVSSRTAPLVLRTISEANKTLALMYFANTLTDHKGNPALTKSGKPLLDVETITKHWLSMREVAGDKQEDYKNLLLFFIEDVCMDLSKYIGEGYSYAGEHLAGLNPYDRDLNQLKWGVSYLTILALTQIKEAIENNGITDLRHAGCHIALLVDQLDGFNFMKGQKGRLNDCLTTIYERRAAVEAVFIEPEKLPVDALREEAAKRAAAGAGGAGAAVVNGGRSALGSSAHAYNRSVAADGGERAGGVGAGPALVAGGAGAGSGEGGLAGVGLALGVTPGPASLMATASRQRFPAHTSSIVDGIWPSRVGGVAVGLAVLHEDGNDAGSEDGKSADSGTGGVRRLGGGGRGGLGATAVPRTRSSFSGGGGGSAFDAAAAVHRGDTGGVATAWGGGRASAAGGSLVASLAAGSGSGRPSTGPSWPRPVTVHGNTAGAFGSTAVAPAPGPATASPPPAARPPAFHAGRPTAPAPASATPPPAAAGARPVGLPGMTTPRLPIPAATGAATPPPPPPPAGHPPRGVALVAMTGLGGGAAGSPAPAPAAASPAPAAVTPVTPGE